MNTPANPTVPTWSQQAPTTPGHYWYWDGKEGNTPTPFPLGDTQQAPVGWWSAMLPPKPPAPYIGAQTEVLRTALVDVCRQKLIYEGIETNAWLVDGVLLAIQRLLFEEIRAYFQETTAPLVDVRVLSSKTLMDTLMYEQFISVRCAAVLHQHDGSFDFSEVVRIDPAIVWKEGEPRPAAWIVQPINSLGLGVIENRAKPNAKDRQGSLPSLMALLRDQSTPFSQSHPTPDLQGIHTVLATYPELAWPELPQATKDSE